MGLFLGGLRKRRRTQSGQLRRELTRLCPVRPGFPHLPWRSGESGAGSLGLAAHPCSRWACAGSPSLRERLGDASLAQLSLVR